MVLSVKRACLFLALFYSPSCGGRVAITPSGSIRGKAGELASVNCTSRLFRYDPYVLFEYNGVDSPPVDVYDQNTRMITVNTTLSQFEGQVVGLGWMPYPTTGIDLNFNLTSVYDGATLRCKSRRFGDVSDFLNLTVLSPPCCNASLPVSINHNTTEPFPPLNCSEIIGNSGNPPSSVQWNLTPLSSGCTGNSTGAQNELYNVNPIGRICNGVRVVCIAKNEAGLTRKMFDLQVKSLPKQPEDCNVTLINRSKKALFAWNIPNDSSGFPLNYNITVYLNGVLSKTVLQNESCFDCFAFSRRRHNDALTFSVSAVNALGTGPPCISQLVNPYSLPSSVSITSARVEDTSQLFFTLAVPSVQDSGRNDADVIRYIVYVNDNPRNFSAQRGDTQTFTITNLKDDTEYEIAVSAVNNLDREGERSAPITLRTEKAKNEKCTPGTLAGAIVGALLAGLLIGAVATLSFLIVKSRNQPAEEVQNKVKVSRAVEMRDSSIYAKTSDFKKEPTYEDMH
eukprot:m.309069 g.309069  ORF g.309069 m.309069 type:complete len:510 (+) comp45424_c0_seq1:45-1574(+)